MKCNQCERPAILFYRGDSNDVLPLCLDCSLKFRKLVSDQISDQKKQIDHLFDTADAITGIPSSFPRFRDSEPEPVTNVTFNNLNIDRSSIGVVNTGNIGTVDTAIGSLREKGHDEVAEALTNLTEAVAQSAEMQVSDRDTVLGLLSVLASEATLPKEQRRKGAMSAIVEQVGKVLSIAGSVSQLWEKYGHILAGLFS